MHRFRPWLFSMAVLLLPLALCTRALAGGTVNLNPKTTAEPISKYIYGQFVEHLGKSIYGGLWAEMLQDRKFFYPVSDRFNPYGSRVDLFWRTGPFVTLDRSPWRVIGPAGTTSMDTQHAYVGEHSVAVHVKGAEAGIAEDNITVVKDKPYTCRIVLAANESAGPVILRLSLDEKTNIDQTIDKLTPDFQSFTVTLTPTQSTENAIFEIVAKGTGDFRIGEASLMPADNVRGWRPDVIETLKALNSPIYRWPGGNFVSGYDWRDGINPNPDLRPPRHNPAWTGVEFNDVGIHEFMDLMGMIGAEPYVALNTGLGSVDNAAAEVEYLNGSTDTPMGKLRAANGHPAPFNVKYFAVGNEMFGNWQKGFMPLDQYVKKHNDVAAAIWRSDPSSQLVAVGQVGEWSQAMLRNCTDNMNFISEHIYCKELADPVAHTAQLADEIKRVADAHRSYRALIDQLKGKNIRICMDEWNYWYGDYKYGELGCQYHFKDALGVARGLHEYFRNSDMFFMANYAQTINVLGCVKVSPTAVSMETTGLALEMYRGHFGTIPIPITEQPKGLDVSAAWTEDKSAITLAVINVKKADDAFILDCPDTAFKEIAHCWTLGNPDMNACNEPGRPPVVSIQESNAAIINNTYPVPAQTIAIYRLEMR